MALNYLKSCCWKQHIGHLKNMRYFPLTMRHHYDLLCRTDWPPRDIVFVGNQERAAHLQKCDNTPKPVLVTVPHVFGRDTFFVLPEVINDRVKSHCNTDAASEKLYSTVTIKKNNGGKITKIKDSCVSELEAHMTLPSTHLSSSESFVPAQGFKGKSVTAPFLESMTFFDGYMATQQMETDQCMKQKGENGILRKCEKNSETDILSCSPKNNKSEMPTGIPKKDLPSPKQLGIIQEKIVDQFGMFLKRITNYEDYDMDNFVFVNNFFGNEKIYKGSQYHWILFGIKLRCHMRFVIVNISVTSASSNVEDGTVKVYWQLVGVTQTYFFRKLWKSFGNYQAVVDNAEYYGGVSVFHINSEGKIYRHRVDRMDQVKEGKAVRQPEMAMA
ncbi:uncharacterized protein LOC110450303 [Mizuhopecten yessoensis]|nr:uncharacterized protein LOC110450303 [Mizuhopecten yessoensis]